MFGSFTGVAASNVKPSRFVKRTSSSGEPVLLACGANESPWGISQPSTRRMALSGWDDGYAAVPGEMLNVYGPGDDECLLVLGADCSAGDYLKSDATAAGVPAGSNRDAVGAQAKVDGKSGQAIPVKPMRFDRSA